MGEMEPQSFILLLVVLAGALVASILFLLRLWRMVKALRQLNTQLTAEKKELKRLDETKDAAIDAAGVGVVAFEPGGLVSVFSKEAEETLGYRREEVIGRLSGNRFVEPAALEAFASELSEQSGLSVDAEDVFAHAARQGVALDHCLNLINREGHRVPARLCLVGNSEGESARVVASIALGSVASSRSSTNGVASKPYPIREKHFREWFDRAPIGLWALDGSETKLILDELREQGVEDLVAHFVENPEIEARCMKGLQLLEVNQAALDLYQAASKDELVEAIERMVLAEGVVRSVRGLLAKLWKGQSLALCERTEETIRGETLHLSVCLMVMPEHESRWDRILVSRVDITAQRSAEMALRSSRERLATIFNVTEAGLLFFDAEGKLVEYNPAIERIFGLTREQMLRPELRDPSWQVCSEDGTVLSPSYQPVLEVIKTGRPRRGGAASVRKADGSVSWIMINDDPVFGEDGGVVGVVSCISDITAQREAEMELRAARGRLRTIFDVLSEGILMRDEERRIIECNAAFERLIGLPREELLGRVGFGPGFRFRDSEGRVLENDICPSILTLDRGEPQREAVYCLERPDGATSMLSINTKLISDADDKPTGVVCTLVDVTERKLAAAELNASRERWKTTFQAVAEGIVVLDMTGAVVDSNPSAARLINVSDGQILQSSTAAPPLRSVMEDGSDCPPEDLPGARTLRTGQPVREFVHGVMRTDGSVAWLTVNTENLHDSEGNRCGVVVSFSDITKSRTAEFALRESEERFRQAFDKAGIAMGIMNAEGRFVRVNRACCDFFGHEKVDIWDRTLADFEAPDERSGDSDEKESWRPEPNRWQALKRFVRGDGRIVSGLITTIAVPDPEGAVVEYIGQIVDMTEQLAAEETLRESEERFRQAFDFAGTGMAILDLEGRILRCNQVLAKFLGEPIDRLLGGSSGALMDAKRVARASAVMRELLTGSKSYVRVEERYSRLDGYVVWGLLTLSLVRDKTGAPTQFICQVEDITARRRADEELRRVHDQALEASRLKSEFLATVSHEIRTPMNGILGTVEMLSTTAMTQAQREMSRVIKQSADSLLRLIDDLLDLSRIEAGKLHLEQSDYNPKEVIGDTLALFLTVAKFKEVTLDSEISPDLDLIVRGDPLRFRQVLTNLLSNALKFTSEGRVELSARVMENSPVDMVTIQVEVEDTGCGIPADLQGRLFQPFVRAESAFRRNHSGAGLGLSISQHLVESMGGEIGFASEESVGSKFWFTLALPRVAREVEQEESFPVLKPQIPVRSLELLVVEDNEMGRFVAKLQLEHLGHKVETAEDGVEALDRLAKRSFDAVLMDCQMPRLDGYETTRRIRSGDANTLNRGVPVIALTAFSMPGDRERGLSVGMNDYITKPLSADSLRKVLVRCGLMPSEEVQVETPSIVKEESPIDMTHYTRLSSIRAPDGQPLAEVYATMFCSEMPGLLAKIDQLYEIRAAKELARAAHSLAGNAANLGASPLRHVLRALVECARTEDWPAAEVALGEAKTAWKRLSAALNELQFNPK